MQWFMRDGVNTPNVGVIRHPRHRFVNLLLFIHHTTHVIDIFRQLWTRVDYLETIQSPLFLWCTDVLARLTRHEARGTSLAPVSVPQLCTRRKMTMNVYRMPYRASKFNELGHPRAPGICARCPAVDLPCRLCRGSLLVRAPTHPHRPLPL